MGHAAVPAIKPNARVQTRTCLRATLIDIHQHVRRVTAGTRAAQQSHLHNDALHPIFVMMIEGV